MTSSKPTGSQNEVDIRALIERWAEAVRKHDRNGILADHDPDMVMFDVPPPPRSRGIKEYSSTWDLFFGWHRPSDAFDVREMEITAGDDVAFAVALMHCSGTDGSGERNELDFRLTIGLRKVDGRWRIVHEHHSVPMNISA
ncbi:MAG: SgcJ/EcaC family oxidoreductase [Rhodospirillales bacterium]|nr:SgcJ/EcaC family oxidoreductase [Rhodospirillales bacterium]